MTSPSAGLSKARPKIGIAIAALLLSLAVSAIGIEAVCSLALIHYYRWNDQIADGSYELSSLVLIEKVLGRLGIISIPQRRFSDKYTFNRVSDPANFFRSDNVLGYVP